MYYIVYGRNWYTHSPILFDEIKKDSDSQNDDDNLNKSTLTIFYGFVGSPER